MKKVWEYLVEHAITVMMAGFVVSIAGLLAFAIRFRYYGGWIRTLCISVVIAGVVVYVLGRVLVVVQRRGHGTPRRSAEDESES